MHVDVFLIVQISVFSCSDLIDDSRLEVDENAAGDVLMIVGLIEKYILTIVAFSGVILKSTVSEKGEKKER